MIDSGRQIYYGPIGKARDYFTSLGFVPNPRQTTADYLTGCTDPNERKIGARADGKPVPTTAEELEAAYYSSEIYAQEAAEATTYKQMIVKDSARRQNFVDVVQEQRGKGVADDSPYTVSFVRQVALLARRQSVSPFLVLSFVADVHLAIVDFKSRCKIDWDLVFLS